MENGDTFVFLPCSVISEQGVLGRTDRLFSFIRHGPHRKRRVQKFFHCCTCIRCHCNVFTQPLPGNDRRIHIETHRLMGGIYEVRRWDGFSCHYIHTKFHNNWFSHSNVNKGDTQTYRRQHGHRISLLSFFQNKETRLTRNYKCHTERGFIQGLL
jgi:hypothetical protein